MRLSADARALRKTAQLARIAKKGDPDYPKLYASQPHEVAKAATQGAERAAIEKAKTALEIATQADARSTAETFGVSGAVQTATADAGADAGSLGT